MTNSLLHTIRSVFSLVNPGTTESNRIYAPHTVCQSIDQSIKKSISRLREHNNDA